MGDRIRATVSAQKREVKGRVMTYRKRLSSGADLPDDFGKLPELPKDDFFRPLTAEDWRGFSEDDWRDVRASLDAEQAPSVLGGSGNTLQSRSNPKTSNIRGESGVKT